MAEPVLTATLLTPISIRLTWTYTGAADFEVFWKSDHPAGQEYAPLGRTSALTYDVGSLSWTTTYYFKVRAVSGATYGAFSNEVEIFVCCGQGVLAGPPATPLLTGGEWWQQGIDIDGGLVGFFGKAYGSLAAETVQLWDYRTAIDIWRYHWERTDSDYPFTSYPGAARVNAERIAILDAYYDDGLNSGYKFFLTNSATGEVLNELTWPNPEAVNSLRYVNEASVQFLLEFNDSNRVVAGMYQQSRELSATKLSTTEARIVNLGFSAGLTYEIWWAVNPTPGPLTDDDFSFLMNTTTQNTTVPGLSYGNTYFFAIKVVGGELSYPIYVKFQATPDIYIYYNTLYFRVSDDGGMTFGDPEFVLQDLGAGLAAMAEAADGAIWIAVTEKAYAWKYLIYKWVEGSGATLITSFPANGNYLFHPAIAAEGTKIAFVYLYSWDSGTKVGIYKLNISTDNGANWTEKTITTTDGTYVEATSGGRIIPIAISDGNLILFTQVYTAGTWSYRIVRSTNDGDTWGNVYTFPTEYIAYPAEVSTLRSDGDNVVFATCGFTAGDGDPMAVLLSEDAGATWELREMATAEGTPTILVPA